MWHNGVLRWEEYSGVGLSQCLRQRFWTPCWPKEYPSQKPWCTSRTLCIITLWQSTGTILRTRSSTWRIIWRTSAKCQSVRKPHPNLPDTPVNRTSASKYFQILPGPCWAKYRPLRHYKSSVRCSLKHLQLRRCIQDAPSRIVKFWSSWDL